MLVLFTFVGGFGHGEPLFPLARAARRAGHDVRVACSPAMVDVVRRAGFEADPIGPPGGGVPATVAPLLPVDPEREERDLREHFAGPIALDRARAIVELAARRRPDLIVSDETDFGAIEAADVLGIPSVTVVVLAAGGFNRTDLLAGPIGTLRAGLGLPAARGSGAPPRAVVAPIPPRFRDPSWPLPPGTRFVRPSVLEDLGAVGEPDPPTRAHPPVWLTVGRPKVNVTLGTVFNMESGDLFHRLLAAVAPMTGAEVLVTVGPTMDVAALPAAPAHVRIERFVPQRHVLPGCDVMVSHGGSGSVIGALALGVPLVLLAMGADQPHNARRCEALGVGTALDPVTATPAEIGEAITAVASSAGMHERAAVLARESAMLPSADDVMREVLAAVAG